MFPGSDSVSGVPKSSDSFKCRCRIFLFISEIESSFFNAFLERMRMLRISLSEKFSPGMNIRSIFLNSP